MYEKNQKYKNFAKFVKKKNRKYLHSRPLLIYFPSFFHFRKPNLVDPPLHVGLLYKYRVNQPTSRSGQGGRSERSGQTIWWDFTRYRSHGVGLNVSRGMNLRNLNKYTKNAPFLSCSVKKIYI